MSVTANEQLLSRRDDVFMATYARPPLALVRGEGSTVYDADGRAYLDLIAGIAVCLLGHAHPKVRRGRHRTAVDPRTHQQPVRDRAGDRPCREAARPARPVRRRRPGLLLQLRRRGQRDGHQDRPPYRPARDHRRRGQLPRPHDGRAFHHRAAGQAGAVRAAAAGSALRALRRRRRTSGGRQQRDGRRLPRADARGGRGRAAARPVTCRRLGRSATHPERCSSWTRCRASGVPAPGTPTSRPGSSRTS